MEVSIYYLKKNGTFIIMIIELSFKKIKSCTHKKRETSFNYKDNKNSYKKFKS
jgi:hypothetical protein